MLDRSSTPFLQSGRGMSADYKSVFRLAISLPFGEMGKKSRKIAKFRLILTPPKAPTPQVNLPAMPKSTWPSTLNGTVK